MTQARQSGTRSVMSPPHWQPEQSALFDVGAQSELSPVFTLCNKKDSETEATPQASRFRLRCRHRVNDDRDRDVTVSTGTQPESP